MSVNNGLRDEIADIISDSVAGGMASDRIADLILALPEMEALKPYVLPWNRQRHGGDHDRVIETKWPTAEELGIPASPKAR